MLHAKMKQPKYTNYTQRLSVSAAMRTEVFPVVTTLASVQQKGKYIFLINNDTYIESDEIAYLVERLESRPEIGGVSLNTFRLSAATHTVCRIYPADKDNIAQQYAGLRLSR